MKEMIGRATDYYATEIITHVFSRAHRMKLFEGKCPRRGCALRWVALYGKLNVKIAFITARNYHEGSARSARPDVRG